MRVLITGGTGTLGKAIVRHIISYNNSLNVTEIVIVSRDEQKHYKMKKEFSHINNVQITYSLGDVRDEIRMKNLFTNIDIVIHAAAMKHVDIAEENFDECIKTNIIGAQNVINACIFNNVKKTIALSTDKASSPTNLYGASKLASDRLFVSANFLKYNSGSLFAVVRYGNVMASNGSVIPFFRETSKLGVLPITDIRMTRFNILIEDGVKLIFYALSHIQGGEIFIPKIPSYNILDLAKAICPNCEIKEIGIRPGEKLHEEMISRTDSQSTIQINDKYIIVPQNSSFNLEYYKKFNYTLLPENFCYSSDSNSDFETIESLKVKIDEIG